MIERLPAKKILVLKLLEEVGANVIRGVREVAVHKAGSTKATS